MKNKFTYILGTLLLSACTSEDVVNNTLSEDGQKTPITVVSNISTVRPVTRAVDGSFEEDDVLQAYIQHVKSDGAIPPVYSLVNETGTAPRLAGFKVGTLTANHHNEADNFKDHSESSILQVTDAQGLYWDDFSNSASAATDLRTSGHYLQSFYGYCYNGGTPSTDLAETTGVLGWTVATNQSTGIKTSDLLYAKTQDPVAYVHGTNNTITGRDPNLTIPYTHAMSKVTVEVICDEGFSTTTNNFANAAVKLQGMNSVVTVNAPTAELSGFGTPAEITTIGTADASTPNIKKSFSALIAPTVMAENKVLAKIENVDGNNYEIKLTDAVLTNATSPANAWSTQLAAYNATAVTPATAAGYNATNGGLTKPGVHYMITVTIKKQQIKVQATIQDWEAVSATGIGQILFDNDINTTGEIEEGLKTNGFDLYKSTTTTFGTKATTITWNTTDNKWEYAPKIYWQNSTDAEYFRALSGAVADDAATTDVNESLAMTQGSDVLWGTTPDHSGKDVNNNDYSYEKSGKIDPRTGDVPLEFEHAMTKISVILKTNDGDSKVNLDGATINIINTYNEGKIDINTGDISDLKMNLTPPAIYTLSATVDADHKLLNQIVIPQSLVNDKDGNARSTTPTFYQTSELTKIYNDNTSLPAGGGTGTYYLTSSLDKVNYEDSELTKIYSDGTSIDNDGAFETYVTSTLELVEATAAVKYTQEEADEENAKHLVADSEGHAPTDDGYVTTYEDGYTAVTTETDRIPAVPEHYKVKADSKKATTSTFKCYKKGSLSEQHTPGELRTAGNKIMLYVTLTDGTRYSIELSKCLDTNGDAVTKWERGEHYTYEITLGKEEIVFRALIKDWVDKTGSGNATLDWD